MAIELYFMPGGPFASRCLMALAFKKLNFLPRKVNPADKDKTLPEFLALSYPGKLPVLKDGSAVVHESQAIMFYLDRAYPKMPLYGETPAEAGKIMQEICEQQSYAEPALIPFIASIVLGRQIPAEDLKQAEARLDTLFCELDRRLESSGWLAGKGPSAADLNLHPLVQSALDALETEKAISLGLKGHSVQPFSELAAWMQRLKPFAIEEY
jgi:glutathione S-transferase